VINVSKFWDSVECRIRNW